MDKIIEVVAALIWRADKFLICQRPAHKARALLWEFAGGKVEGGETREQALVRECREELAIEVEPESIFAEADHVYPDISIHLTVFNCRIYAGEPQLLEHNALKWITKAEIENYQFCPADKGILRELKTMKKIKITAMRKSEYKDLMDSYENSVTNACEIAVGQTFILESCDKPDGLCDSAWGSMLPFIKELFAGGGNFFDGWMKNPKSAMISCNDGFRPVSFYIEVIE